MQTLLKIGFCSHDERNDFNGGVYQPMLELLAYLRAKGDDWMNTEPSASERKVGMPVQFGPV